MSSAYQKKRGGTAAKSEPKPGQSESLKKKRKKKLSGEKKSLDNKNNDSTVREEEWVWTDNEAEFLVNTTPEYKVDKCSVTPLVLSAGREEMHM